MDFEAPLECYPNGNSTAYVDLYNLPDVTTLIRGSFRYAGFAATIRGLIALGFFSKETLPENSKWLSHILNYCEFLQQENTSP
jgi:saccharopine dehydrogenase-like NADP-dependent oxidoreductase